MFCLYIAIKEYGAKAEVEVGACGGGSGPGGAWLSFLIRLHACLHTRTLTFTSSHVGRRLSLPCPTQEYCNLYVKCLHEMRELVWLSPPLVLFLTTAAKAPLTRDTDIYSYGR